MIIIDNNKNINANFFIVMQVYCSNKNVFVYFTNYKQSVYFHVNIFYSYFSKKINPKKIIQK
jgi:hypothetical protein